MQLKKWNLQLVKQRFIIFSKYSDAHFAMNIIHNSYIFSVHILISHVCIKILSLVINVSRKIKN